MSSTKNDLVFEKLEQIELEMRRIGYWKNTDINIDLSACKEAFCSDLVSFEEWLQFIFIPNATKAANENALPKESNVGVKAMREYNYMSIIDEALPLSILLSEFDTIVNS